MADNNSNTSELQVPESQCTPTVAIDPDQIHQKHSKDSAVTETLTSETSNTLISEHLSTIKTPNIRNTYEKPPMSGTLNLPENFKHLEITQSLPLDRMSTVEPGTSKSHPVTFLQEMSFARNENIKSQQVAGKCNSVVSSEGESSHISWSELMNDLVEQSANRGSEYLSSGEARDLELSSSGENRNPPFPISDGSLSSVFTSHESHITHHVYYPPRRFLPESMWKSSEESTVEESPVQPLIPQEDNSPEEKPSACSPLCFSSCCHKPCKSSKKSSSVQVIDTQPGLQREQNLEDTRNGFTR